MSFLDALMGIRSLFNNGVELITRKALDFKGDFALVDNPVTGRTEITVNAVPGLTWQGDWDDEAAYAERDAVVHAGSAWIATGAAAAGDEPGVAVMWDLLAGGFLTEAQQAAITGAEGTPSAENPFVLRDWLLALLGFKLHTLSLAADVGPVTHATLPPTAELFAGDVVGLAANSRLLIFVDAYWQASAAANCVITLAIGGSGAAHESCAMGNSVGANFTPGLHLVHLTGALAAGTHTLRVRWRAHAGTMTCSAATNDFHRCRIVAVELPSWMFS